MSTTIKTRRDTAANWAATNPVLAVGEQGFDTTNNKIKVGDGSTAWSGLSFLTSSATIADGDKGDITVTGTGATWTIDADVVTNAKLANVATATFKGRTTAGTGDPEDLTATQATALLDVAGAAKGLMSASDFTKLSAVATGATANAADAALRDRTTHTGVQAHTTISPISTARFIGRTTAGSGAAEELTGTQATALLDVAGAAKGLMSAADFTKLGGVATGATANATDASLRDRTTHTGVQAPASIQVSATARILGRTTAAAGPAEELTAAQTKTLLAIANTDVTGLGTLATASSVNLTTQATGVLQAAQHPALTGDVTNTVSTLATTIANDAVSNAKLANMATATFKGRTTAGTGDPEDLTATQATALLNTATTALKGLAPASGGGTTNFLRADLTWAAPPGGGGLSDADYGDVTVSGSGTVMTVDADVVTNTKLANVATNTIKGRVTAATGDPEDLTPAQAVTVIASGSGGGTTNFLRADGTWAAPGGGGGGLSDGDYGDVVVSGSGTAMAVEAVSGALALSGDITPATLTATTNDWNPTDWNISTTIRVATDSGARTLTGLAGGSDGRMAVFVNVGTFDLVVAGQDAASTAANRFTADTVLPGGESATFRYDATLSRWHLMSESTNRIDRARRLPFVDFDFEGSVALSSMNPFSGVAISSGTASGTAGSSGIDANHIGIWRLTSSTTANGGYYLKTTATAIRIAGGEFYECIMRPLNLATTTFRIGFTDTVTSADAVDGVYIEVPTTGLAVMKSSNNSTRTTSATIATVAINTWYRFRVSVDRTAANATGTIYDMTGAVLGTQTVSTNIPTGSGRETGCGLIATESSTTATAMVDVDYMAKGYLGRGLLR